jgi:multicomponent Na+:H+ antiporter subunit D
MVLAIGFFTPYSIAAAIFYITHHILVKGSLFLCGGVVTFLCGSDDLKKSANLWSAAPLLGIVFFIQAMSLAGLPPLSGFWGKYMIIVEGMNQGAYVLVAASVVASVLTLFSMLKIWLASFWTENPDIKVRIDDKRWKRMTYVIGGIAVISVAIGFGAQFFFELAMEAAEQVLDRATYIERVLVYRELP